MKRFFQILGPGLLYAGAAVGVSHLVQSTRAGAGFGFELAWVILAAHLIKYPFFEFGTRYAISSGKSLIEGYQSIGKWAVGLFFLLSLATMFAVQAAITLVTAGLAAQLLGLDLPVVTHAFLLLGLSTIALLSSQYLLLDKLIKWVMMLLALSTIVAVIMAFAGENSYQLSFHQQFYFDDPIELAFLIALAGWMPAPIDISVWSSLWTLAKNKSLQQTAGLKEALLEYRTAYIGTALLAFGFLSLGALVMHQSGVSLSENGIVFSEQLVSMYTQNIGQWSYPIISLAALLTMFSTTISVLDAYPRSLGQLTQMYLTQIPSLQKWIYAFWLCILFTGTLILIAFANATMAVMVDLATTLSFVAAPVLAYLNHRVVFSQLKTGKGLPNFAMRIWSISGLILLSLFSLAYIYWKLFW